jgi:hypothetical protein
MNGQTVPNDSQPTADVPLKMFQELDDLRCFDAAGKKPEIEVPDVMPAMAERHFQLKNTAAPESGHAEPRCEPGAVARSNRSRPQTLWFDAAGALFFYFRPTHPLPPLDGRFIALGGPPTGRWQLQPKERKIRQTCPG